MGEYDARPVLLVVMGTSGCGKSTFGEKLAQSLSIPFIDGDDLHPKENVEKMSRGEALTDDDRIPWLRGIREKALQVTHPILGQNASERERSSQDMPLKEETRIREMAEVYETSRISEGQGDTAAQVHESKAQPDTRRKGDVSMERACVIACSALKKSYRDLLRGDSSSDLHVVHIYLHVEAEELKRRMHARKGHFMKESMLQSQLDTLEEPTGEKDTITIQQGRLDEQIHQAREQLEKMLK